MTEVQLVPLETSDREQFIKDNLLIVRHLLCFRF